MSSTSIRFALAAALLGTACAQTITTIAGNGTLSLPNGDGGPAIKAVIGEPQGIALDSAGNIYFADHLGARVRKVDGNGIISTYAGGGFILGNGVGDGGPATSAVLGSATPHFGIAFDPQDNLYIADLLHYRVRKVDKNGIITTVAGTGTFGFSGDGGPAVNAQLGGPVAVALDGAGNLYIADRANGRVRMVDTNGIINTVAGSGTGFVLGDHGPATGTKFEPVSVAVDHSGNLYISDFANHALRK